MKLVVVGVNHKTAPVALREKLAFGEDLLPALDSLKRLTYGSTIVSTCNRSEVYAYLPDERSDTALPKQHSHSSDETPTTLSGDGASDKTDDNVLVRWLASFKQLDLSLLAPYLYVYEGNRALTHWLRVSVGLDSMILGEPQILGQIKQAVAATHEASAMTPAFDWLTQRVFGAARIVRRDTSLGKQAVTLGFATAKLVTQIFDNPSKTTLLVVAAGEMNRLVAHNVAALGMQKVIICNRSAERAELLAAELRQMAQTAGRAIEVVLAPLTQLDDCLKEADVVSSCSGSMQTLIDKPMVKAAMKARKNRAMLMVDLAVPRDIAPDVGEMDGVYLYSIDDLQHVIAGNLEARKQAAIEAEVLVGQLACAIEDDMQMQAAGKLIAQYQAQAELKKDALLSVAKKQLSAGVDPETVLTLFAQRLTKTLAHPPSRLLRNSAKANDEGLLEQVGEQLLGAYRQK